MWWGIFAYVWISVTMATSAQRLTLLYDDIYHGTQYVTLYGRHRFSFQHATQGCQERGFHVAVPPIPSLVMGDLERLGGGDPDVWVAMSASQCGMLKKRCKANMVIRTAVGGGQCRVGGYEWLPTAADCESVKNMVLCASGPTTTPTTTTSTTTTTTTTTTTPTTTPTTTTTTAATTKQQTTTVEVWTYLIPQPTSKPASEMNNEKELARKTGLFLIAMGSADKRFLGLIIAVVTGTFLIAALFACIIFACRRKSSSGESKRYELIHGFSINTMDRGHRTDTTTDTSLEDGSSDDHSHSVRHDDMYGDMDFPSMLPPPPILQEQIVSASVCDFRPPSPMDDPSHSRRYNTMGGRMARNNAVDNNIYSSINRHRKQEMTQDMHHIGQELPLPPPPPPPPVHTFEQPMARGTSQCSIAGCRSDTGTVSSVRSLQSRQSRQSRLSKNSRRMKRGREGAPPQPTSRGSSSDQSRSKRNRTRREQIELVSTNL